MHLSLSLSHTHTHTHVYALVPYLTRFIWLVYLQQEAGVLVFYHGLTACWLIHGKCTLLEAIHQKYKLNRRYNHNCIKEMQK